MGKTKRRTTRKNIFDALDADENRPETAPESPTFPDTTLESPTSMISADNHSQIADKPCGTVNADGTTYGGGPLDVVCGKCTNAGFPHEYAHGHRANQRKWCPLLQTKTQDQANEALLSPKLKPLADDCLPKQKNKTSRPLKEVMGGKLDLDPDTIMLQLAEGVLNPQAAKLALLGMMRTSSSEDRQLLQIYIDNIAGTAAPEPRKTPFSFPGVLKSKGKLCNLYKQTLSNVLEEMHKTGKQDFSQKPVINLLTGAVTVDAKDDAPAQTVSIFLMTMERFRHVVVIRDYLSETELHAMLDWVHMQLALGRKLVVIERTVKALLLTMDQDHNQDLCQVIRADARTMLADQQDIHDSSFQRTTPATPDASTATPTLPAKTKAAARRAAKARKGDDDDVTITLEKPNDVCCWYDTNGLQCANKLKVNGVCKYQHLHGTCGMPLSDGTFCLEKHKAADHS